MATQSGRRIVEMVWEDLTTERVLGQSSFENAIKVHMAMGGSTNAIIHVVAMAKRAGVQISLADFDRISRKVPVIANVRPSGAFLMEDFFYAGGLRALMSELRDLLDVRAMTVTGKPVADNIAGAKVHLPEVIHSTSNPISTEPATGVLYGNLAPRGAIIKPSAVEKRLLKHRGPALAFEDYNHMASMIDRDDLDVTADHVLVLKNSGPKGGPGMPEWGMMPIPTKLVKQGVRDMLRVSDARMSGTSYGACVLHVSPESYVGGPLAFVKTGDPIEVDVAARTINLMISDEEMAKRKAAWVPPPPRYERGYGAMFSAHIGQAEPVIGIINTWSDINPCHTHLRQRAEEVKRGVLQAGGFPIELPAMSLAEVMVKPTTMLYRNFLAMETEELLRSHPIDGAVLLGGCDKTTPGAHHGRDQHGAADDLRAGRADAARQLAGQARSARARTCGNTGTRSAPATSPKPSGTRSRTASRARSAPA